MNIIINKLPDPQSANTWVGIDTELFGMDKNRLHRPNNGRFASLQIAIGDTAYVYTSVDTSRLAMGRIMDCVWVFQNAKFDLTHMNRWFPDDVEAKKEGKIWDTYIIDRIMYGNYYDYFSLEDLVRRYLDVHLDKEVRESFEDGETLSEDQIQYAGEDAYYTLKVAEAQKKKLSKNEFSIWRDIDLPALRAIMDFKGFRINAKRWREIAHEHEELAKEYKETFNLNPASPKQVKEKLNELGADVESTGADILEGLIDKNENEKIVDIAERVLNYRSKAKLASTYGMNWINRHLEDDLIFSDYKVIGAATGRTSSSSPNMQNIPARDTSIFRECFIPREGNKLIVADYSAQEPRILAYLAQDQKMIDIFNAGKDIYIEVIKLMYDKTITKDDPFRQEAKAVILGAGYGLSPYGYAKKYDVTEEEAEKKLDKFFNTFPDIQNWVYQQEQNKEYVESILGRKFWLNPYSYQSRRHTRNAPIQGTAGDQLKLALAEIHQKWNRDYCEYGIVGEVHDEIIADVPEECAEKVAQFIQFTMERVANEMCPGVNFEANAVICDTWAGGK